MFNYKTRFQLLTSLDMYTAKKYIYFLYRMTQDMSTLQLLAGLLMVPWLHFCSAELVGP